MLRSCLVCGRPSRGNRCDKHAGTVRNGSTRRYRENRAIALAGATTCWICHQPFTPGNPATADHVIAHSLGGSDDHTNLRPAHLTCNDARGAGRTA